MQLTRAAGNPLLLKKLVVDRLEYTCERLCSGDPRRRHRNFLRLLRRFSAAFIAFMATLSTIPHTSRSLLTPFRSQTSRSLLSADPSVASKSGRYPQTLNPLCSPPVRRPSAIPRPSFPTSPALISAVDDLFEFICAGPLLQKTGFSAEKVAEGIDKWLICGGYLCRLFNMNELRLNEAEKARIYHFYVPVFLWCEKQVKRHASAFGDAEEVPPPLVIGISAPQGSGKTTLVFALEYLFRRTGRNAATLSIDDFYLTADEQAKLRSQNSGNALLELRGNAGSHDLQFSLDTLTALKELTKAGTKMKLPRYEKSAHGGRGDRANPSTWPEVEGPLTVVLFEGWMLGFKPLPSNAVKAVDPQLEVVNQNLEAYYDAWETFIDTWIIIKIKDPNCVFQWRLQAEVAMREDGKPGMSDEEVFDFVSRYLPAYKAYLPTLYSEGPRNSDKEGLLVIDIDEERNPISEN